MQQCVYQVWIPVSIPLQVMVNGGIEEEWTCRHSNTTFANLISMTGDDFSTSSTHRNLRALWSSSRTDTIKKLFQYQLVKLSCKYGISEEYLEYSGQILVQRTDNHLGMGHCLMLRHHLGSLLVSTDDRMMRKVMYCIITALASLITALLNNAESQLLLYDGMVFLLYLRVLMESLKQSLESFPCKLKVGR